MTSKASSYTVLPKPFKHTKSLANLGLGALKPELSAASPLTRKTQDNEGCSQPSSKFALYTKGARAIESAFAQQRPNPKSRASRLPQIPSPANLEMKQHPRSRQNGLFRSSAAMSNCLSRKDSLPA